MYKYLTLLILPVVILGVASTATAQTRVPDTGMFAVGADVGLGFPTESELEQTVPFGGYFEYYFTPRMSVRPSVFFSSPQVGNEPDTNMRDRRVSIDGIYNWERGAWHPFAGAGLGIHMLKVEENDFELADGTKLGLDLLAGIEYFTNRDMVIKGEFGYQPIDNLSGWPAPSSFMFSVGLKWYFQ